MYSEAWKIREQMDMLEFGHIRNPSSGAKQRARGSRKFDQRFTYQRGDAHANLIGGAENTRKALRDYKGFDSKARGKAIGAHRELVGMAYYQQHVYPRIPNGAKHSAKPKLIRHKPLKGK